MSLAACPACGSRHLRDSTPQNLRERLSSLAGIVPLRCRRCGKRFSSPIWDFTAWRYAHCPKCLRMDLAGWSEEYRKPPMSLTLKMRLGAKPYRCEICRLNFASFRALKEPFCGRGADKKGNGSK